MNRTFISIVLTFALVAGFLVFQATRESAAAVLLPSDLARGDQSVPRYRIRVAGKILEPVEYKVEPVFELKFSVRDPGKAEDGARLPVIYRGIKPDMFTAGRDVIIDGEFHGGTLVASKLLTQCPSKYEPPQPGKGRSAPQPPG